MNVFLPKHSFRNRVEIEYPDICEDFHDDFRQLINSVIEANEAIVSSCRAFFTDISSVSTYLHKVSYWESECDKFSTRLQTAIYAKKERSNRKLRLG